MKFLEQKTSWSNKELWLFKACLFSGGIAAGSYFQKQIELYFLPLLAFSITTTIWIGYLWIKKLNIKTEI
jgi:hypothetical protein